MEIEVTTKAGGNYTVTLDNVWQWIQLERDLGKTYTEITEAVDGGSLDTTLQVIFSLAKDQGKTDLKTLKVWVQSEYENFEFKAGDDPKASTDEDSATES
jgi:hypothetical protein